MSSNMDSNTFDIAPTYFPGTLPGQYSGTYRSPTPQLGQSLLVLSFLSMHMCLPSFDGRYSNLPVTAIAFLTPDDPAVDRCLEQGLEGLLQMVEQL